MPPLVTVAKSPFHQQRGSECKRLTAIVNDLNNQHTASCCNFPWIRASRHRGRFPSSGSDDERRQAMSYSISTLLLRNLSDVFGENDPVRRRAAIDDIWNEDGVFYRSEERR